MIVYLNSITGVDDALVSLLLSKRSWTREKELHIRRMVRNCLTEDGFLNTEDKDFLGRIDRLIKYGVKEGHTTLLRFIDLSYTVEGLHRGAQDDFDSHARRLDSRIVRASTRLATFDDDEKSNWYHDKIMYPFEICKALGIALPNEYITPDGTKYVKATNGYINAEYLYHQDGHDVRRGLYPLAIPSNFIFKAQLPEFAHIVQHRDKDSHAHPELKQMIECAEEVLIEAFEPLGLQLTKIKMQRHP